MRQAVLNGWRRYTGNLLGIPITITVVLGVLGVVTIQLGDQLPPGDSWLFAGGPDAARTVLGAIVTALITVVGLVFSITIIVMQLSSSQFSPRVLKNLFTDRITQITAGVFLGVVVFGLLGLRAIPPSDEAEAVPELTVTVAIVLALAALLLLLIFIHHISQRIQVSNLASHIARQTLARIDVLHPEPFGQSQKRPARELVERWEREPPVEICALRPGFLQQVDVVQAIAALSESGAVRVHFPHRPGSFVGTDTALARIWDLDDASVESHANAVRRALPVGNERTLDGDVNFGLRQLADIAVRALSSSLNDPTTAATCIGYIGAILTRLAKRETPAGVREIGESVTVAEHYGFSDHLGVMWDIAREAGGNTEVIEALISALGEIARVADGAGATRRAFAARELAGEIEQAAPASTWAPRDHRRLRQATARARGE